MVDSVALNERVRLLQEELTALLSERANQTLFILTVVTVLALPMTIIPGLLGMNIQGILFSGRSDGFWIIVAIVICIVGMGATLAWMRLDR